MKNKIEYEICIAGNFDIEMLKKIPSLKNYTPTEKNLTSIYFDDQNFSLFRNKIGLRLRKTDENWEQTLKLELTSTKSIEYNKKIIGNESPKKINKLFLPDKKTLKKNCTLNFNYPKTLRELKEIFFVKTKRVSWVFDYLEGKLDLSLDLGKIVNGVDEKNISELDIELISGSPSLVWYFALELFQVFPFSYLEIRSKVLRGVLLDTKNHYLLESLKKNKLDSNDILSILTNEHKNLAFFFLMSTEYKNSCNEKFFFESLSRLKNALFCLNVNKKSSTDSETKEFISNSITLCNYFLSQTKLELAFLKKNNKRKILYLLLVVGLISNKT